MSIKIELRIAYIHGAILFPDLLIPQQYFFLIAGELTAHAVELILILVVEHIDIQIPHEAGGTTVV